jgi:PilZ domain
MSAVVQRDETDWQPRRGSRRRVSMLARVDDKSGPPFRVLVRNLSYEGCEILSERALELGQALELSMPGGAMKAQVRWVKDDRAGLVFLLGNNAIEERRTRIGV